MGPTAGTVSRTARVSVVRLNLKEAQKNATVGAREVPESVRTVHTYVARLL
jgi:hypothetical protein